jgi:hypothetical protein
LLRDQPLATLNVEHGLDQEQQANSDPQQQTQSTITSYMSSLPLSTTIIDKDVQTIKKQQQQQANILRNQSINMTNSKEIAKNSSDISNRQQMSKSHFGNLADAANLILNESVDKNRNRNSTISPYNTTALAPTASPPSLSLRNLSTAASYSCLLCEKSFKRQDHLNGHLLTHQDKKPFECRAPNCDKSYCDSRSLKRHVESQHQEFLAQLTLGNQEVLHYLPSIAKIKANLAPNLQKEIIISNDPNNSNPEESNDPASHKTHASQYSPVTPIVNNNKNNLVATKVVEYLAGSFILEQLWNKLKCF